MINLKEGAELELKDFEIQGRFLTPDASNVAVVVYNDQGVEAYSKVFSFDPAYYYVMAGELLFASLDAAYEFFTIKVTFQSNGKSHTFKDIIRLQRDPMIYTDENSVRTILGASEKELPNEEIDIYGAYAELSVDLGISFISNNSNIKNANDLITYHEALKQLDSLELKLLKSDEFDDIRQARLAKFDYVGMKARLTNVYIRLLNNFTEEFVVGDSPLLTVVTRTDPFLGS